MSRETSLIKNTGILALGDFFPRFLTVIITPILTAQLTKHEYGEYDLIVTMVSLLLPIATLQISSAAFRFLINNRDKKDECKIIVSTIYTFVLFMAMLAGTGYYFSLGRKSGVIGLIISAYFVANIFLITTQQILRGMGNNLMYSISAIFQAVISLTVIFFLTGGAGMRNLGLLGVVISLFLSSLIPCIVAIFKGKIIPLIDVKKFSFAKLKVLLSYSWPMVPNNLSSWVLTLSDRLVITAFLGIEANAMYAVANKLPQIFNSMQGTFIMAWQENPALASEDNDKDEYYSRMCDWVYRLLTGLMAGLIMCTPVIWRLLIRGEYSDAYYQLPVLYMGMLFSCMSSTLGGIYIAHMKTKSVGLTTMAAAAVNLFIDFALIKIVGIWAGSLSTMISYLVLWIYRMIDIQKFQEVRINKHIIVGSIVSLIIMAIVCFQNTLFCNLVNVVICCIVLALFDRDIITFAIRFLNKKMNRRKENE